MTSSPTSGSARQRARNKGLARMSAVTRGVGAASVLGAVAIAVTLPQATAAGTVKTARPATTSLTSSSSSDDNNSSDDNSGTGSTSTGSTSSSTGSATSQLQTGTAPSTTNNPPAATSGGS